MIKSCLGIAFVKSLLNFSSCILFNGSSFTTVDALNIQANGRVGIGTTSPSTMLHATSGTSSNSAGMFENTDNSAYSSAAEGHLNNVLILNNCSINIW